MSFERQANQINSMTVKKGLITAAGDRERRIPLQTLVDSDGTARTVLAMLVNEMAAAGIEDIGIVIPVGQSEEFQATVAAAPARVQLFEQREARGYAGALWTARDFLAGQPFLHLVGDHVYVPGRDQRLAGQLVAIATQRQCSVSAVQPTHESQLTRFGVIGGRPVADQIGLYHVDAVAEKPTPTAAEQSLIVGGLRAGHYLAFFGMHVWTPAVLELLAETMRGAAPVSEALHRLSARERYLAWNAPGHRYDLGPRYGLLQAQLALGLSGDDREEVLAALVGLIATHGHSTSERRPS